MYQLSHIEFSGESYPYIIDLNVLETIQEKYSTVQNFERMIIGFKPVIADDGSQKKDEKGNKMWIPSEPDIKTINFILPEMINEGLAIEARRSGKEYKPVDPMLIMADCDIAYQELADIIHEEFARRFVSKKSSPSESRPRARKRSTSNGSTTSE